MHLVRDDFESQKASLESKLSTALGVPWTVTIDVPALYQHATNAYAKENPGKMITKFVTSFIDEISYIYGGKLQYVSLYTYHFPQSGCRTIERVC